MAFKEILQEVVESCGGGLGGIVMGYDGISVEAFLAEKGPFDVPLIAVEYSSLLKEILKTVAVLKSGELEEVTILSDLCQAVIRPLNREFFVALLLRGDGNLGKGRYLLKCASPRLIEELS